MATRESLCFLCILICNLSNLPLCVASLEKSWLDFIKLCIANYEKTPDVIQIRISRKESSYSSNRINKIIPSVILCNPLNYPNSYGQLTKALEMERR